MSVRKVQLMSEKFHLIFATSWHRQPNFAE
jgi:hypothetical protein